MKTRLLFLVCAFCALCLTAAADVALDAAHFPDTALRNYVSYYYDRDEDGILSTAECQSVKQINQIFDVTSLKGIEYFPNLEELAVDGGTMTSVDLSYNPNLLYLWLENLPLDTLDLSNQKKLLHLECYGDKLTTLDLTPLVSLTALDCTGCGLTELNLSPVHELTYLNAYNNQLTEIDLSNNRKLEYVSIYANQLTNLDVHMLSNLVELNCSYNNLSTLTLGTLPHLDILDCQQNQLTELDISGCSALRDIYLQWNKISELNLSGNGSIESVSCTGNNLTSLDVSQNSSLYYLACDFNKIESLDVSANHELTDLYCHANKLLTLDVSNNTKLSTLQADDSNNDPQFFVTYDSSITIPEIDLSRISNLTRATLKDGKFWPDFGRGFTATIKYAYDCGLGYTAQFYFNVVLADHVPAAVLASSQAAFEGEWVVDDLLMHASDQDIYVCFDRMKGAIDDFMEAFEITDQPNALEEQFAPILEMTAQYHNGILAVSLAGVESEIQPVFKDGLLYGILLEDDCLSLTADGRVMYVLDEGEGLVLLFRRSSTPTLDLNQDGVIDLADIPLLVEDGRIEEAVGLLEELCG